MKSVQDESVSLGQLYGLLDDWRELTIAEAELIHLDDWSGLDSLQSKKTRLQELIGESETSLFSGSTSTNERKSAEKKRLRQIAAELLVLEEKNREALAAKIAVADSQLKFSNKTIRNLRHVQQAYGTSSRSFWQAYS